MGAFVNIGAADMWGLVTLLEGCPVHCRMLSSFSGVFSLNSRCTHPTTSCDNQNDSRYCQMSLCGGLGGKLLPAENHWASPCRPSWVTRDADKDTTGWTSFPQGPGMVAAVYTAAPSEWTGHCPESLDNRKSGNGEGGWARSCKDPLGLHRCSCLLRGL